MTLQQPAPQRPAWQHSPALQSFAVAQQLPAEQSFEVGSQHSPALQSALVAQAHWPQSPSWQHSPAWQSAAVAQQGSHVWPWQHCPAWQSAVVQQSPATQRGEAGPAPELLTVVLLAVVLLAVVLLAVAPPPAPVVALALPPLPQPGPAAQTRASASGIIAATLKRAGEGDDEVVRRFSKVISPSKQPAEPAE